MYGNIYRTFIKGRVFWPLVSSCVVTWKCNSFGLFLSETVLCSHKWNNDEAKMFLNLTNSHKDKKENNKRDLTSVHAWVIQTKFHKCWTRISHKHSNNWILTNTGGSLHSFIFVLLLYFLLTSSFSTFPWCVSPVSHCCSDLLCILVYLHITGRSSG